MKKEINIVFVADDNYIEHVPITIESIMQSLNSHVIIMVYIIDAGIRSENILFINKRYENEDAINVEIIEINNNILNNYEVRNHISQAAYGKVYLPNLVNKEKVIYLDADLIVMTDIEELWDQFDSSNYLKAVWNPFYDYDNKFWNAPKNSRTFNSGVMLMNLEKMRSNKIPEKLKEFIDSNHNKTKLHDQAAFNAVFFNEWKELDYKWNVQVAMLRNNKKNLNMNRETYNSQIKNPSIVHFTSNSKPWQFRNSHPYKKEYQKLYYKVYDNYRNDEANFETFLQSLKEKMIYIFYKGRNIF